LCRNELARALLAEALFDAVKEFGQNLSIDPRTCKRFTNLMRVTTGLATMPKSNEHKVRYLALQSRRIRAGYHRPYRQTHRKTTTSAGDSRARQHRLTAAPTKKATAGRAAAGIGRRKARAGGSNNSQDDNRWRSCDE